MRCSILILGFFLALFSATAKGQAPATQPTSQPAEFSPDAPARKWFADLASADASKRDEAQTNLMGLSREDLPALRQLIIKTRPLAPAQVAALHEIVMQVFLAGETYESDTRFGFLGLRWLDAGLESNEASGLGVPIEIRLPGFPGFKMLREGDLILAVLRLPDAPIQQLPNLATPNREILTTAIKQAGGNTDVVFEILRQGQVMRVPIRLAPYPSDADIAVKAVTFTADRQRRADEYWQQQFAPLLHQDL